MKDDAATLESGPAREAGTQFEGMPPSNDSVTSAGGSEALEFIARKNAPDRPCGETRN